MPSNLDKSRVCTRCGAKSSCMDRTFHRFPKVKPGEFELAQKWALWCYPNQDWSSFDSVSALHTSHRMLCSKHFAPELIFMSGRLRKGSIPSLDLAPYQAAAHVAAPEIAPACDDSQAEVLPQEKVEVKQELDEQAILEHVCRVCLRYWSDAGDMKSLLRDGNPTEAANALTAFSPQIKICGDDNLPMQVCDDCAREAICAERFYRRVEEAHARLASLTPNDIVQYSLSLSHYFPKTSVSSKLGEDEESAVISLRYDGAHHLELSFNNELSTSHAATEKSEENISDKKHRRRNRPNTEDTIRQTISVFETLNQNTQNTSNAKRVQYESLIMEGHEDDTQQVLATEYTDEDTKEAPLVDKIDAMPLALTAALESELEAGCDQLSLKYITDLETTVFRCYECHADFVTHLEAEHHMTSAHGPVPAYVCHECSQTIATKQLLRDHLSRHSGVEPYQYQRSHNGSYVLKI